MCVNISQYPLVELDTGKKKVLFNYGVVIENRDFTSFDNLSTDWNLAIHGFVPKQHPYFNRAVKQFGISKFLKYINVPCGKCEDCLKSKARGWAFRILKEAERFENNYFITLTYDNEHLPATKILYNNCFISSLEKNAISDFNKKLKTNLFRLHKNSDFRFYGVGEYGSIENTARPHYHVIYFNLDLVDDLEFYKYENGEVYYTSKFLSKVWKNGHVVISGLGVGAACYVSRYCDKKLNRTNNEKILFSKLGLVPEFSVMSRRPGIAAHYLDSIIENFKNGVYKFSSNGNDFSLPIYYCKKIKDKLAGTVYLENYEKISNDLIKNKINRDLVLSDIIGTDSLQDYYLSEDSFKKSCKRLRNNII